MRRCCGICPRSRSSPRASARRSSKVMADVLKIALLTHSTNPRGGVVHVLELGRALLARGHEVTVLAPAAAGQSFFRETPCRVELAVASPRGIDLADTVRLRIDAMRKHLATMLRSEQFDVFHAHDGIGGNALADLAQQGAVAGYLRTVHHVDRFDDSRVPAWEHRSIRESSQGLCVSALWRDRLRTEHGIDATQVANGGDLDRFTPHGDVADRLVAARQGGGDKRPLGLSVGGIAARKNTRGLFQALVFLPPPPPPAPPAIA